MMSAYCVLCIQERIHVTEWICTSILQQTKNMEIEIYPNKCEKKKKKWSKRKSERVNEQASKDSQMLKLIKHYRVLLEISFNVFDPNVNSKQSSFSSSLLSSSHSVCPMNLPHNSDNDDDDEQQVLLALKSDCCLLCSTILLLLLLAVVVMVCVCYKHIS